MGKPFVPKNPTQVARAGIAYVPEGRVRTSIVPALDVAENVTLASLRSGKGLRSPVWSRRSELTLVRKLLTYLDTKPAGAETMEVDELSGGNQQKIAIARWLVGEKRVFIFDEPTEGVDVAAREEIYSVLRQLAADGAAVIVSTSDVEEVVEYADRILIMKSGTITEQIPAEQRNVAYVSRACLQ